ncbi:MAG TPA: hypothetical protein VHK27_02975, partial [Gammaproteobacteria bacterium]|nr:hypothetical protein [Gammaproteobacteria bacterium]
EDKEAVQAFRAALGGEVNNLIITPGAERPLWVDESLGGRMLAQFKSFAMSSTSKTLMAGLQQRDMAFVNGVMVSLALGALSYYLWAVSAGGKSYTEMMNAGPDKWADEAIQRSGVLTVFGEIQRIGERIPLTQPYTSFSGTRSTRRGGGGLVEALAGPSFDFGSTLADILTNIDDPTKSTVHDVRTLMPYQNLFLFRQALDAVEEAAPFPERRQ